MPTNSHPYFLVTAVPGPGPFLLDGPEGRHAAAVRRMRVGERLVLTDGAGTTAVASVIAVAKSELTVEVGPVELTAEAGPRVVIVQALPKGDRSDLAVDLVTEAGADGIIPWSASRCVARWTADKAVKGVAKWQTVAREAAKQSRRARVPQVHDLHTTKDLLTVIDQAELALVLHEAEATPLTGITFPAAGDVVLIIGPEGGIAPEELTAFRAAGAVPVRLGHEVLRTSTAGAVALGAIGALTGRWHG
ncbi:16S rRNA (uracil(1498)-N(3))-methyltransferase [Nakamurella silvestris]|nr:16S rRNA (uracil(1498)-N(3))-methyltransferase [Nakamurella silvestris]